MRKLISILPFLGWSVAIPLVSYAKVETVAYYRLGEADAASLNPSNLGQDPTIDSGPNHLNLARFGLPHYSSNTGVAGSSRSMLFNPATLDAYVREPIVLPLDNVGIEAWVKSSAPVTGSGLGIIAINGFPIADGFGLARVEDATPFGGLVPGYIGKLGSTAVGFAAAIDQQWTHLALVRDGGKTTFYVNGSPAGSSSAGVMAAQQAFSIGAAYCAICAGPVGTLDYLNGQVDEVRLFRFEAGQFNPAADLFLTAVPEPSSAGVLLIGVALLRRRPAARWRC
jgi:hypothetical protein